MTSTSSEGNTGTRPVPFYPYTESIFWSVFDFFGTLDIRGRVISLAGSIFEQTKIDPKLLIGQQLSETVFWQASENTSRTIEEAIEPAAGGKSSRTIVDFRISSDRKVAVEVFLQPLKNDGHAGPDLFFRPAGDPQAEPRRVLQD